MTGAQTASAHTHLVRVRVDPPYPVVVGAGTLARLGAVLGEHGVSLDRQIALVSDGTVAQLHGAETRAALERAGARVTLLTVPPGEGSKSLAHVTALCSQLSRGGVDRSGLVVALGGGVIGDLAGFVAAVYLRGLPFVQVPTSLLALVDASVGGKTGVNLPEGKNLVGAFHQPLAVLADTDLLRTLPPAAFREGAVELVKAGWLADPALAESFLRGDWAAYLEDGDAVDDYERGRAAAVLAELIARAVQVKADVVAADPTEQGVRAHLNLGHTLAHALETASEHALPHGEAVAYGLMFAAELGAQRGWSDWRDDAQALLRWVAPQPLPDVSFQQLLELVARDKKRIGAARRFVLLRSLGEPTVVDDVNDDALARAWSALREVADAVGPERS